MKWNINDVKKGNYVNATIRHGWMSSDVDKIVCIDNIFYQSDYNNYKNIYELIGTDITDYSCRIKPHNVKPIILEDEWIEVFGFKKGKAVCDVELYQYWALTNDVLVFKNSDYTYKIIIYKKIENYKKRKGLKFLHKKRMHDQHEKYSVRCSEGYIVEYVHELQNIIYEKAGIELCYLEFEECRNAEYNDYD